MAKKIKIYKAKDLANLKSWEYKPLDVEHTYLVWPIKVEGTDVNDIKRVAKAIKLSDLVKLILK